VNFKRHFGMLLVCGLLARLAIAAETDGEGTSQATPVAPKRKVVAVPLSTLDSYVGRYELAPEGTLTLFCVARTNQQRIDA